MSSFHLKQEMRNVKSTKRITITIPYATLEKLWERTKSEGRSLSNLAAYVFVLGQWWQLPSLPSSWLRLVLAELLV
jgi:hypothetical protein